jgi:hypothetical protein
MFYQNPELNIYTDYCRTIYTFYAALPRNYLRTAPLLHICRGYSGIFCNDQNAHQHQERNLFHSYTSGVLQNKKVAHNLHMLAD